MAIHERESQTKLFVLMIIYISKNNYNNTLVCITSWIIFTILHTLTSILYTKDTH